MIHLAEKYMYICMPDGEKRGSEEKNWEGTCRDGERVERRKKGRERRESE